MSINKVISTSNKWSFIFIYFSPNTIAFACLRVNVYEDKGKPLNIYNVLISSCAEIYGFLNFQYYYIRIP